MVDQAVEQTNQAGIRQRQSQGNSWEYQKKPGKLENARDQKA